ncbi:MAG: glycosyltransferase family 1 protein [Bacteroidales bacterium]
MKIVVNARLLIKNKLSGLGWFAYHTLKRIVKSHPEHQFVFLFDRNFDTEFIFGPNVIPEVVFPPTRHPLLWYLWFEHAIVTKVKRHNPALFFSPDGYLSTRLQTIPSLPVIHDINFHHDKRSVPLSDGLFWRYFFPKYVNIADRILTVSQFSKNDIAAYYNISGDKIDVVYNGADEGFVPLNFDEKSQIKKKYSQGEDYFIYVGVLVPRKNICRMIQAFDLFRKTTDHKHKLMIVGDKLFFTPEMKLVFESAEFKKDIIFTGRLDQEELVKVVGAAFSLILVSTFEGFGIPVIEAMYSEIPVITSNFSSLPEIAGDAAVFADPYSVNSIKDAMLQIAADERLRLKLIEKGKMQRRLFNWDYTAEGIWTSMQKITNI